MGPRAWREIGPGGAVIAAGPALALRLYQLSRPGYLFGLTEYDDGTFFGNSVRLAYGAIPYRDFVSVEPPGSTLLMLPVALIAKVVGTAWGFAMARVLTMCADVVSVTLVGLLVRHRGPLAAVLACGILAVYPDGIVAAHTLLLEPWLNLFCLAGAVAVFDGGATFGRIPWTRSLATYFARRFRLIMPNGGGGPPTPGGLYAQVGGSRQSWAAVGKRHRSPLVWRGE